MWSAETGRDSRVLKGHKGRVQAVAVSPDGERIASAGQDGACGVWNAESGQEILTLTGHESAVTSVEFNPDGTRLATGSDDSTVRLLEHHHRTGRSRLEGP